MLQGSKNIIMDVKFTVRLARRQPALAFLSPFLPERAPITMDFHQMFALKERRGMRSPLLCCSNFIT
jgi:hypothetical protein